MEIYEQKLKGFQEKTDSLEEENKFLQKQLFEKVQQIEILEIKRNEEFENNISEKENKLYQLQQQILKLEEHQKLSFICFEGMVNWLLGKVYFWKVP
uniref:Uncharacterized protein n=1 Tax=Megaselia scalaris TaxID=36166 RepID=T1GY54_MEGSC